MGITTTAKLLKSAKILSPGLSGNFSFTFYTSIDDSTIWKKYPFWIKNVSSFKNQLMGKVQSFIMWNFDLHQRYKIVLTQTHLIRNFHASDFLYVFIMIGEMIWSDRKCSKIQVWKRLDRVGVKNLLAETTPEKIFGTKERNPVKLDKTSKACYLIWQLLWKFNFWKKNWELGCLSTESWHFPNIF